MTQMITAVTKCDRCGALGEMQFLRFGSPARLGLSCSCGGVRWTIGRYGNLSMDGDLVTRLMDATPDEMRQIAEAMAELERADAGLEQVVATIAEINPSLGAALHEWVKENGGWLQAAGLVVAILFGLQALFGQGGDTEVTNNYVIFNDGTVAPTDETPNEQTGSPIAP